MKTKNFIVVVISIIVLEMKGHVANSQKQGITKRFKKLKDYQRPSFSLSINKL
jgi:hypothetical protein